MASPVAARKLGSPFQRTLNILGHFDPHREGVVAEWVLAELLVKVHCSQALVAYVLATFGDGAGRVRYKELLGWIFQESAPPEHLAVDAGPVGSSTSASAVAVEATGAGAGLGAGARGGSVDLDNEFGGEAYGGEAYSGEAYGGESCGGEAYGEGEGEGEGEGNGEAVTEVDSWWAVLAEACAAKHARLWGPCGPRLGKLMAELKKVDVLVAAGNSEEAPVIGRVEVCEPSGGGLLEWDAEMSFPSDSPLGRSLEQRTLALAATAAAGAPAGASAGGVEAEEGEDGGEVAGPGDPCRRGAARLALRVQFPLAFPEVPPEVWVRHPRLVPPTRGAAATEALLQRRAPAVTFGGRVCMALLSSDGWEACTSMPAVFQEVGRALVESRVEVAVPDASGLPVLSDYPAPPRGLARLATELYLSANGTEEEGVHVVSPEAARPFLGDLSRLERTDKIVLPVECLEAICSQGSLESPAIFEVKTRLGRKRHCMVFDWMEGMPEMHAILPRWLMDDLGVEDYEPVRVRGVRLELASFVKVQPRSADFYDAVAATGREVADLLYEAVEPLGALTEDTTLPIRVGGRVFGLHVLELRPQAAVRIVDGDVGRHFEFEVDFEPAPAYEDDAARWQRQERCLAAHRAQRECVEAARLRREARRAAAIRSHFLGAWDAAREAAAGDDGAAGAVEICLQFPDGSQLRGRFREGAPAAALLALALSSAWAEARGPWGLKLRERAPPRVLGEGEVVTPALHRAALVVEELLPPQGELSDEDKDEREAEEGDEAKALHACPQSLPPHARPRSLAERSSQAGTLRDKTLEQFELHRWLRAGEEPSEALRRARRGEAAPCAARLTPPPVAPRALPQPPPARGSGAGAEGAARSATEEAELVEQVVMVTGATPEAARRALQATAWHAEGAANALLDSQDPLADPQPPRRPPRGDGRGGDDDEWALDDPQDRSVSEAGMAAGG